jgi:threo-3-hydroxy-L-aspartate ammonia-lyase
MYEQILAARARLTGIVHHTPVMTSRTLDERVGVSVYLKCENLQRVGAFKIRGAYNAISKLTDAEKARGVITHSSGNHAQGVALASKLLGVRATIVMPNNAPAIKLAATRDYGATIVLYDPEVDTREAISARLAAEHGYVLIPPYDHPDIVAGQGTAAHELLSDVPQITTLLTPCGGGGLLSGSAIAARGLNPACRTIGVEPELADDATRSFQTKTLHTVKNPPTIADGTRTPSLGKVTFPLVLEYVADMVTVSEHEIMLAVQFLFYRMKLVVEPSGALGVAALLVGKVKPGGPAGVILSGGNVDAETMSSILKED